MSTVKNKQVGHAVLSPSGASRWIACTPSARLEQQFPDKAGDAAKEGTLAHSLGELLIRYKTSLIGKAEYEAKLQPIQADKFYSNAMFEHAENYAVFVLETLANAKEHTSDALLFLEQKLDLTAYIPEGFGTGDAIIIADGVMFIIDLKYGKGVPVSSVENKQMMLYSLGALHQFDCLYDIHTVSMTIYQPRLDTISTWELAVGDLKQWAETELIPRAALAFDGKGNYLPGAHCRFCRASAVCKANADFNLELAQYDFKDPAILEDKDIALILDRVDLFKGWLKSVEGYALDEAVNNGKIWPGYKLVEGRSNRVYKDIPKIEANLLAAGYAEDKIYAPRELVGITALEKLIGKKTFAETLSVWVEKPKGAPTLVPESDKREPYVKTNVAADFAD